ncbi:hypothetical protein CY34DRAFT_13838 [Suillus luteus UH-Slu-Lm8-n1]|uniref:Uncharacterized protein n=1 Tax=Suillus luteus UH-Slu-Lm8-n1 TaxID=930992 RepID=A0A0D0AQD7_9AGAM|nr:hypothetical protein CY34DRAFT_13838 [Suillus luteus UH-Slu-Lm8-n1]
MTIICDSFLLKSLPSQSPNPHLPPPSFIRRLWNIVSRHCLPSDKYVQRERPNRGFFARHARSNLPLEPVAIIPSQPTTAWKVRPGVEDDLEEDEKEEDSSVLPSCTRFHLQAQRRNLVIVHLCISSNRWWLRLSTSRNRSGKDVEAEVIADDFGQGVLRRAESETRIPHRIQLMPHDIQFSHVRLLIGFLKVFLMQIILVLLHDAILAPRHCQAACFSVTYFGRSPSDTHDTSPSTPGFKIFWIGIDKAAKASSCKGADLQF